MRLLAVASVVRLLVAAVAVVVVGLGCLAGVADAQTFMATDTASLVTAVQGANSTMGANTIVLAGGTYAPKNLIELTNTTGPITIEGPAPVPDVVGDEADIEGSAIQPAFGSIMKIDANVTVNLDNLEISGGGGSTTPAVDDFGAVDTEGLTTQGNNGAFTIESGATGNLVNSTFIGNLSVGVQDEGSATLINDTVSQNGEGGIDDSSATTLGLVNTVVADNPPNGDCFAPATSSVNSLDSDGSCGVSLSGKNPLLAANPSLSNGGSTPTDPPEPGSPLIGAAKASDCPPTDQRGFTRPASCDIGAVQTAKVTPVFNTAAVQAQTSDSSGTTVTYTPSWVDASSPVISTCTPSQSSPGVGPQMAMFALGTTPVSCNGVDAFGNKGSGQFNVTLTLTGATTTTTTTSSSTSSSTTSTTTTTSTHTTTTTTTPTTTTSSTPTTTSTHTTTTTSTPTTTSTHTTTTTTTPTTTTSSTHTTTTTTTPTTTSTHTTTTTSSPTTTTSSTHTTMSTPTTTTSSTHTTMSTPTTTSSTHTTTTTSTPTTTTTTAPICTQAPTITDEPGNLTVFAGQSATFTAAASTPPGCAAPSVQWEVSADGGTTFAPVSGATSTSLTISDATTGESGDEYRAAFTNAEGPTDSAPATLTVKSNAAPVVTGVFPHFGTAFSVALIGGKNLGGATEVDFGSSANWFFGTHGTAFIQVSDSLIVALVPPGSGRVDVTVTTPNGTSATSRADRFTYVNRLIWRLFGR